MRDAPGSSAGAGVPARVHLQRLRDLLDRIEGPLGARAGDDELLELPRLYRLASTELARLETTPHDRGRLQDLRALVARAHQALYSGARERESGLARRALRFFLLASPRAIRAEWKLLAGLLALFYGLAAAAFLGVRGDLELAFALQPPATVERQIEQLRELEPGQPFRGNFTFGMQESGTTAGMILANNIRVALIFFGAGLVPPLFLLVLAGNALMLGTYLGVASHWGQAGEISSILWCHGTIELQMIALGGAAGLVLARAWIRPGPWSRAHAMALESRRAWALVSPAIAWLFFSGLIEGYVSPHAPLGWRLFTAAGTGLLLAAWVAGGARSGTRLSANPLPSDQPS